MDVLSELATEIILEANETHGSAPIPEGAVIGFDTLKDFVNSNQQPMSPTWKLPSHYPHVHEQFAYLRTITIPETMAKIYVVKVPQNPSTVFIETYYVPAIAELIHNPDSFGHTEELDRERSEERKLHIPVWGESHRRDETLTLDYLHIHGIGLSPPDRNNRWLTFFTREAAEAYADQARHFPSDVTPLMSLFGALLEEECEAAWDEYEGYDDYAD